MIDWFSGHVGYDGSDLALGQVVKVSAAGTVLWSRESWETAEGSFASGMQVSRGSMTDGMEAVADRFLCHPIVLRLSGNPAKYLQGHNVFGPPVSALGPVIQAVVRGLPPTMRPSDADSTVLPAVHRARVDIAVMLDLRTHSAVHSWLQDAARATRSRHGRAMVSGSTVYWGKNSTRWSLKAYCKWCELRDHPPLSHRRELAEWCRSMLRVELTLRRPELKPRGTLSESVVWEYYERLVIGVGDNVRRGVELPEGADALTGKARSVLRMWLDGNDVRHDFIGSRTAFYRTRRQILDATGLDISLDVPEDASPSGRVAFDAEWMRGHQVTELPPGLPLFRPAS